MTPTQRAADTAAAVSATAAGASWLVHANEVAQFVASIVAIGSGMLAGIVYLKRLGVFAKVREWLGLQE